MKFFIEQWAWFVVWRQVRLIRRFRISPSLSNRIGIVRFKFESSQVPISNRIYTWHLKTKSHKVLQPQQTNVTCMTNIHVTLYTVHGLSTLPTPFWPNTRHSKTHLADCFLSKSTFFSLVTTTKDVIVASINTFLKVVWMNAHSMNVTCYPQQCVCSETEVLYKPQTWGRHFTCEINTFNVVMNSIQHLFCYQICISKT